MLELLICTIDDGIHRAARVPLPRRNGVAYLIGWQHTEGHSRELPEALRRSDIRVIETEGRGLSANRNRTLAHARGDLLLIADDDCRYTPSGLETVIRGFTEHPEANVLLFQAVDEEGKPHKAYAGSPFNYAHRPRGYFPSSCEIALRRLSQLPRFDERFGLGSSFLGCGEEVVFLHTAQTRGLNILYLPHPIVTTGRATTGTRFATSPAVQRAKGALLALVYGRPMAELRCLKEAFALPRTVRRFSVFREMLRGIRYFSQTQP